MMITTVARISSDTLMTSLDDQEHPGQVTRPKNKLGFVDRQRIANLANQSRQVLARKIS